MRGGRVRRLCLSIRTSPTVGREPESPHHTPCANHELPGGPLTLVAGARRLQAGRRGATAWRRPRTRRGARLCARWACCVRGYGCRPGDCPVRLSPARRRGAHERIAGGRSSAGVLGIALASSCASRGPVPAAFNHPLAQHHGAHGVFPGALVSKRRQAWPLSRAGHAAERPIERERKRTRCASSMMLPRRARRSDRGRLSPSNDLDRPWLLPSTQSAAAAIATATPVQRSLRSRSGLP